jgi:phosphatidylglycerophosphatase C
MAEGAASGVRRTVLFDFDGVLVRGDVFSMFMRDRYARVRWRKGLVLLLGPLLLLVLPFSRRRALRALVSLGLLGLDEARYRELATAFAATLVRQPGHFCRDGLRALRRHQAAGDRIVIVTGCEDAVVRGALGELGLADLEVLASRLRPGRFGMRPDWHNVGKRKVESLTRHGIEAWHVAYGDSLHDLPMLALAAEAVLVNATPKLCKRVEKALGRSVTRVEWK